MNQIPIKYRIQHLDQTMAALLRKIWFLFPNDKFYLKIIYWLQMGHKLNLDNPKTFTEKLQWLKLYNRKPEYTTMVDKYAVKEYVARIIGNEHIIPTLGVWSKPEEIEWDKLPEKFVLKVTYGGGGGGVFVCRDKKNVDKKKIVKALKHAMKVNIYGQSREWPYKNVPHRIIAEELLEDDSEHGLMDYKVFCCNGNPKYIKVNYDVSSDYHVSWYDSEWNSVIGTTINDPVDNCVKIAKPDRLDLLCDLASKLSKNIPFVRVDFYIHNGNILFGEMTLFPGSGYERFVPESFDQTIGELIKLPERHC